MVIPIWKQMSLIDLFIKFAFHCSKYSGVPNSRVVPNKHVGWTSGSKLIAMWSLISMWLEFLTLLYQQRIQ